MPRPVIAKIVAQFADNAAFLWLLRDGATIASHFDLDDFSELDERVEAHLDGLRVAGERGWEICQQELTWKEAGDVFAGASLALEGNRQDHIDRVLEVAVSAPELERGFVSALGWNETPAVANHLDALVRSGEPAIRRIGLAGYAVQRQDPGQLLVQFLKDDNPRVRARALKAVAELGRRVLLPLALQSLRDEDNDCRFHAACTAIRFAQRDPRATQTLAEFVGQPGPRQREATSMAVRGQDITAAKAWVNQLGSDGQHLRLATIGAGVLGDPELVETLINLMKVDELARVAGESFTMITGVDLSEAKLERDKPEGFESGPTEDPADENVAMDEDENLPWPDADLVAKWWSSNYGRFQPGRRYLCGREISVESARQTLVDGKQRQRAAAAMELAMLQPHEPLFNVCARGQWQQQWLKGSTS